MENKGYKRIPVLPETKKKFDIAKATSECGTQDEFIQDLLTYREMILEKHRVHRVSFPSFEVTLCESEGRILITRDNYGKKWVDITDIIVEGEKDD